MRVLPILAGVLAVFLLSGCDDVGKDGYSFEEREWTERVMGIVAVEYDSLDALRLAARNRGAASVEGAEIMAFSVIHPDRILCEIHIMKPEVRYMPEYIGHEVAHCFYGRWHSSAP